MTTIRVSTPISTSLADRDGSLTCLCGSKAKCREHICDALHAGTIASSQRYADVLGSVFALGLVIALSACGGGDDGEPSSTSAGAGGGSGSAGTGSSGASATGGISGGASGNISDDMSGGVGGGVTGGAGGASGADPGTDDAPGCGSTNHGSGTRVKMRLAVTDEGDTFWQGFHDTALGIDCTYTPITSDEAEARCLPDSLYKAPAAYTTSYYTGVYYTDASCSQAVYALESDCLPDYLLVPETVDREACVVGSSRLYRRGALYTPTSQLYRKSPNNCAPVSPTPEADLYQLGAEQDISIYTEASLGEWASAGGLAVHGYLGVDGSRSGRTFWDTTLDQVCGTFQLEDGARHCVASQRLGTLYADAACSERRLLSVDTHCGSEPPPYAFTESATTCETLALYRVLDAYSGTAYSSNSCTEPYTNLTPGYELYATEPADPAEVGVVQEQIDATDSGRLQRMHYRNADGACLFSAIYDNELGTECGFIVASDGQLRCMPGFPYVIQTFIDDACSVETNYVTADNCGALRSRFAKILEEDGCSTRGRVYRVLPEPIPEGEEPTVYLRASDGSCEQGTLGPGTHFRVGEEVIPAMMMSATIEIR